MIYEIRGGWFDERFNAFAVIDRLEDAFDLIAENAQRRIGPLSEAQKQNLRGHVARLIADPDAEVNVDYRKPGETSSVFYEIRKARVIVKLHRANLRAVP